MKASTVTIPVKKNHMEIHWHDYADKENPVPIAKASLDAKASVIGRVGIMTIGVGFMMGDRARERVQYAETKVMIG